MMEHREEELFQAEQYYVNPYTGIPMTWPQTAVPTPSGTVIPGMPGGFVQEESYIENILRLNRGKVATIYMTFENNREWNAKIFRGIVEAAGRDHIVISDERGRRYLLPMVNLDYVTFEGELAYEYPVPQVAPPMTQVRP